METDDTQEDESGTYALHTLGENETIARLATGIKRFKLPDEFNFIKIYQQIADEPQSRDCAATQALEQLAQIFENRRQYPKAADYWRRLLKEYPNAEARTPQGLAAATRPDRRQLGPVRAGPDPAGRHAAPRSSTASATASQIEFTAHEINVEKLLDDVKAYLKSNPRQLDWNKINIGNIGYRLVDGEPEAVPRPTRSAAVADGSRAARGPFRQAGDRDHAAAKAGGVSARRPRWPAATPATSSSGSPTRRSSRSRLTARRITTWPTPSRASRSPRPTSSSSAGGRRYHQNRAALRDRRQAVRRIHRRRRPGDPRPRPAAERTIQWLVTATTRDGRFAYLGFTGVWYGRHYDAEYNADQGLHDHRPAGLSARAEGALQVLGPPRPVRPWTTRPQFAGQQFTVEIYNPKGERIVREERQDRRLRRHRGRARTAGRRHAGRVSARRPRQPRRRQLPRRGVQEARVRGDRRRPDRAGDAGREDHGHDQGEVLLRLAGHQGQGEVQGHTHQLQRAAGIPPGRGTGSTGRATGGSPTTTTGIPAGSRGAACGRCRSGGRTCSDTARGGRRAGGRDRAGRHGEGRDRHRRRPRRSTPTRTTATRSPPRWSTSRGGRSSARATCWSPESRSQVYAWVDRGYYRVGDTIHAHFSARTLDGKPVEGKGELTAAADHATKRRQAGRDAGLRRGNSTPTPRAWPRMQLTASQAGQYRLSYKLTDAKEHTIEGGYVFTIIGEGFDGAQFRFNHLELIPDKREYAPGDTVKLQINTDRVGGTVLLFLRPTNGVYLPPQGDPPGRQEHGRGDRRGARRTCPTSSSRRSPSPTAGSTPRRRKSSFRPRSGCSTSRSSPSKEAYKPGEKAKVKLKLTDSAASRSSARPSWRSTTRRSSTSPAARTCRTSRSSSGSGGATTTRRPRPTWAAGSAT